MQTFLITELIKKVDELKQKLNAQSFKLSVVI